MVLSLRRDPNTPARGSSVRSWNAEAKGQHLFRPAVRRKSVCPRCFRPVLRSAPCCDGCNILRLHPYDRKNWAKRYSSSSTSLPGLLCPGPCILGPAASISLYADNETNRFGRSLYNLFRHGLAHGTGGAQWPDRGTGDALRMCPPATNRPSAGGCADSAPVPALRTFKFRTRRAFSLVGFGLHGIASICEGVSS